VKQFQPQIQIEPPCKARTSEATAERVHK